jgi:hypothetical protein
LLERRFIRSGKAKPCPNFAIHWQQAKSSAIPANLSFELAFITVLDAFTNDCRLDYPKSRQTCKEYFFKPCWISPYTPLEFCRCLFAEACTLIRKSCETLKFSCKAVPLSSKLPL